jgi:hypothetical protein
MKMKLIHLLLVFSALAGSTGIAADSKSDLAVALTADYTYPVGAGDSLEKSRALAMFGAKLKAVALAAKYLTHKGLLEPYGKREKEIFCLTANQIAASVVEEKSDPDRRAYDIKIRTEIGSIDFIKAEIRDLELEKNEYDMSYREEMEQFVIKEIDPGLELSHAYRLIRKGQWRLAIIYLNHLAKKYPHWGDVYLAKALGYYGQNDSDSMLEALKRACSLNNQEACSDLNSISR